MPLQYRGMHYYNTEVWLKHFLNIWNKWIPISALKKKSLKQKARICSHGVTLSLINLLERLFVVVLILKCRSHSPQDMKHWVEWNNGCNLLKSSSGQGREQLVCTFFSEHNVKDSSAQTGLFSSALILRNLSHTRHWPTQQVTNSCIGTCTIFVFNIFNN